MSFSNTSLGPEAFHSPAAVLAVLLTGWWVRSLENTH